MISWHVFQSFPYPWILLCVCILYTMRRNKIFFYALVHMSQTLSSILIRAKYYVEMYFNNGSVVRYSECQANVTLTLTKFIFIYFLFIFCDFSCYYFSIYWFSMSDGLESIIRIQLNHNIFHKNSNFWYLLSSMLLWLSNFEFIHIITCQ